MSSWLKVWVYILSTIVAWLLKLFSTWFLVVSSLLSFGKWFSWWYCYCCCCCCYWLWLLNYLLRWYYELEVELCDLYVDCLCFSCWLSLNKHENLKVTNEGCCLWDFKILRFSWWTHELFGSKWLFWDSYWCDPIWSVNRVFFFKNLMRRGWERFEEIIMHFAYEHVLVW